MYIHHIRFSSSIAQQSPITQSALNLPDTATRMSYNPRANSGLISPPPEEHLARPIAPKQPQSTCYCHKRYSTLARSVQTVAAHVGQRPPTTIQPWEFGRFNALLGLIEAASDIDCSQECMCHNEYDLLTYEIRIFAKGAAACARAYGEQYAAGKRSADDWLSWERHAADIQYLYAMIRACKRDTETLFD